MRKKPGPTEEVAPARPWMAPNIAMITALLLVFLTIVFFTNTSIWVDQVIVPGGSGETLNISEWLKTHPVPEGKAIYPVELTRTSRSSVSIVQLSESETFHVHQKHDLAVTILGGKGTMHVGSIKRRVGPGDVILIPAGTTHAFVMQGKKSHHAAALVVFTPPFDGKDKVDVELKGVPK